MKTEKLLAILAIAKEKGIEDIHIYLNSKEGISTEIASVSVSDITSVEIYLKEEPRIIELAFDGFLYNINDKVILKHNPKMIFTVVEMYLIYANGETKKRYGILDLNMQSFEIDESIIDKRFPDELFENAVSLNINK